MTYFIIAGEASGDLHGSNLITALKKKDLQAEFICFGGDLMEKAGGRIIRHYRELAYMGLIEVVKNLDKVINNLKFSKLTLKNLQPDVLILIDYPAFNLRMAQYAKQLSIPVFYYISPKIWAWKESRIKKIKAYVDEMFVIFPFEVDFYQKHHYPVHFEGNPLVDKIDDKMANTPSFHEFTTLNELSDDPIIALMPGSRQQEIERIFPTMLSIVDNYPEFQFVVAATPFFNKAYYQSFIGDKPVKLVFNQNYELLHHSKAAIVTSGTATLETALVGTPQIVCYATSKITFFIGQFFVHIKYFSLVNIILDKEAVKELLQHKFNTRVLMNELDKIIYNRHTIDSMKKDYQKIRTLLGEPGASKRIAEKILQLLHHRNQ